MVISLNDLAALVEGELHGDGTIVIEDADTLRDATTGQITFIDDLRLLTRLANSPAAAAVVPLNIHPDIPHICVARVQDAFAKIVSQFRPVWKSEPPGIHPTAIVSSTAKIHDTATIHAYAVIGDHVEISARSIIHSGVRIMAGCRLGEDVTLFPNVVLYENTIIGDRSLLHASVTIGAYGFGYNTVDGQHRLSAQLGNVVLGNDVEIGAGSAVDRGTYGSTVIGDGTKIDNQVQVAHNCRLGKHNVICSQVGIAGSTTTGDYVVMAGQVGVRDHVHIGTGAMLGAKAGVINDIPDGGAYVGIPATPERAQMTMIAALHKLPELKKQVKALQRVVDQMEESSHVVPGQQGAA